MAAASYHSISGSTLALSNDRPKPPVPVIQPGCCSGAAGPAAALHTVRSERGHSATPTLHSCAPGSGALGVLYNSACNYQSLQRGNAGHPDGVLGSAHQRIDQQHRLTRTLDETLRGYSSSTALPAQKILDEDLVLSLVDESRESFEGKVQGKVPLSEQHLLALVDPSFTPQNTPNHYSWERNTQQQQQSHHNQYTSSSTTIHSNSNSSSIYNDIQQQPITRVQQQQQQYAAPPPPPPSTGNTLYSQNTSTTSYRQQSAPTPPAPSFVQAGQFDPYEFCRELELQADLLRATAASVASNNSSTLNKSSQVGSNNILFDNDNSASHQATHSSEQHLVDVSSMTATAARSPRTQDTQFANLNHTAFIAYNCAKCEQPIGGDKPGCTALNQTYHLDCFTCTSCSMKLAGGSFYAVDGKPYCEKDYMNTLEKCTTCGKPIMERILRATGKPYHPSCFKCTVCQKPLDGVPFTVDAENATHCVTCFHEKYAPRCASCSKPIVPEEGKEESFRVVAMDKSFHMDCYKCEDCGMKLSSKVEGAGCYPLDEHLYCKNCNAERVRKLAAS